MPSTSIANKLCKVLIQFLLADLSFIVASTITTLATTLNQSPLLEPPRLLTVLSLSSLSRLLSLPIVQSGTVGFLVKGQLFTIDRFCSNWSGLLLFSLLVVLTVGVKWRSKAVFLIVGGLILVLFNLARLAGIFMVYYWWGWAAFNSWHDIFYEAGTLLATVGLWMCWLIPLKVRDLKTRPETP